MNGWFHITLTGVAGNDNCNWQLDLLFFAFGSDPSSFTRTSVFIFKNFTIYHYDTICLTNWTLSPSHRTPKVTHQTSCIWVMLVLRFASSLHLDNYAAFHQIHELLILIPYRIQCFMQYDVLYYFLYFCPLFFVATSSTTSSSSHHQSRFFMPWSTPISSHVSYERIRQYFAVPTLHVLFVCTTDSFHLSRSICNNSYCYLLTF